MIEKLKKFPFYIILLPIFFVWHGFAENSMLLNRSDIALLIAYYTIPSVVLYVLVGLISRNWQKAALFIAACLIVFFFFGAIFDFLQQHSPFAFLYRYSTLLIVFALLLAALALWLKRTEKSFTKLFLFINSLLLIYLLIDTVSITRSKLFTGYTFSKPVTHIPDSCKKPDIYLLLYDEYASSAALQQQYHFHNNLDSFLTQRGFRVLPGSRGNYNYTHFSMASMLNMDYLPLSQNVYTKGSYFSCFPRIRENYVVSFLEANGYNTTNLSIFDIGKQTAFSDRSFLHIKTTVITENTLLSRIQRDLQAVLLKVKFLSFLIPESYSYLASSLQIMEQVKNVSATAITQPRFVYAHLYMPHWPYYCDRNGNPFPAGQWKDTGSYPAKYLEYLLYTNTQIEKLVTAIQQNTHNEAVILVMGDHGLRFGKERSYYFPNFNAVYLPGSNYSQFYDTITNVNEFRALFNTLFKQQMPLLKDSTVFLEHGSANWRDEGK